MYYNVNQITLPVIREDYQRLIDMRPGETLTLKDRSFVLLGIERTGLNVEPVYNLETSDLRASMRIVNGNVLLTTVNKSTMEIKNESIPAGDCGLTKQGGFYRFRRRDIVVEGCIRGEPLRDGDSFEIHKGCGRFGTVVAWSGEPTADKREYIVLEFTSLKNSDGKSAFQEMISHKVLTEQCNYQLQKVAGDVVYVNNFMEHNLKHIA